MRLGEEHVSGDVGGFNHNVIVNAKGFGVHEGQVSGDFNAQLIYLIDKSTPVIPRIMILMLLNFLWVSSPHALRRGME